MEVGGMPPPPPQPATCELQLGLERHERRRGGHRRVRMNECWWGRVNGKTWDGKERESSRYIQAEAAG